MIITGIPDIWSLALIVCFVLCMIRVWRGPTPADRIVATDILGILIVGFCVLFAVGLKKNYFIDIGIAWALLGFIGAITLAKYLEGKNLDE